MRQYLIVKSVLDWIMAIMLLLLFLPFGLLIALAVKYTSQGPVFFKQERLGRHGRIFRIYKFRTMVDKAISMGTGLRTDEKDPRITGIGRILRKTSLDELPQLFNVLKGEMSFIGPRPPVPYHPYKYENYDENQKKRFLVKPGISGYAQVKVRNNATWDERIVYDVEYVERIGFWFDFYLMLATISVAIRQKNINSTGRKNLEIIARHEKKSEDQ